MTVWTEQKIRDLGVRTDLETANEILGLSRAYGYQLAKRNEYPVPVLTLGRKYVVPVAGLLKALVIEGESAPLEVPSKSTRTVTVRVDYSMKHIADIELDEREYLGWLEEVGREDDADSMREFLKGDEANVIAAVTAKSACQLVGAFITEVQQ
ncbi:hypothetical protein ACRAJ3_11610 [Rhodococcus pyridinivorans]|uniref:hypothetical protein n=1 Tax=Rhodococcus pyridinivorans TaxID=103816 RepID=UPI003D7F79DC